MRRLLSSWLTIFLLGTVAAYATQQPPRKVVPVSVPRFCVPALLSTYADGWTKEEAEATAATLLRGESVEYHHCSIGTQGDKVNIKLPSAILPLDGLWETWTPDGQAQSVYLHRMLPEAYGQLAGMFLQAVYGDGLLLCPNATVKPCLNVRVE